jgi:hypothetical protein
MAGCGPKEGPADPAHEAAEIAVELDLARERVCDGRTAIHDFRPPGSRTQPGRHGRLPQAWAASRADRRRACRPHHKVINESPFAGEGPKVTAQLSREHGVGSDASGFSN